MADGQVVAKKNKHRVQLTAKVRRGLRNIHSSISLQLILADYNHMLTTVFTKEEIDDMKPALDWIEQFASHDDRPLTKFIKNKS